MRSLAIATEFLFLFRGLPRRYVVASRNDIVWAVATTAMPFEQLSLRAQAWQSPGREISLFYFDYSVGKRHFPTFIKKSILLDSSRRAGAGMLAHICAHSRTSARYALATHVIIQIMYFIYYITHKILKICKNIA